MNNKVKSHGNGIVILLLMLFFPVGLYLMWTKTNWNKNIKIVVTVIIALLFFLIIFTPNQKESPIIPTNTTETTETETTETETTERANTATVTSAATAPPTTTISVPVTTIATTEPEKTLTLISASSPVSRNETATLTIKGKPNTDYTISVYYSTTASRAQGLEEKTSDSGGYVTWEWKVGGQTTAGQHKITIKGENESITTFFTTTEG